MKENLAMPFPEKWAVIDTIEANIFLRNLEKKGLINVVQGFVYENFIGNGYLLLSEETNELGFSFTFPIGYTEVTIEDLIAHYEVKQITTDQNEYLAKIQEFCEEAQKEPAQPKWMPLTMGGKKIVDVKEIGNWVVYLIEEEPIPFICNSFGHSVGGIANNDLIPHNPRKIELEKQKAKLLAELELVNKELGGVRV